MQKQIFQTEKKTRWKSFIWGFRILIVFLLVIITSVVISLNDKKNINCAIKTMRMFLQKSCYIGTGNNVGLGRYWQPLKDHPKTYVAQTKKNKASILKYTRSLPYCQN
jgi:hypothetical protein